MNAQAKPDEVTLVYDPYRGGFELEFCHRQPVAPRFELFGGIMGARITEDLQVACVDGIWDRGGVLLNSLYFTPNVGRPVDLLRRREIALKEDLTHADQFLVRQTDNDFEIWFGSAPLSQPPTACHHHASNKLLSVWMAAERVSHPYLDPSHPNFGKWEKPVVVGLRLEFPYLAATYPIKTLSVWTEDIK